jgi:glutamate dehydrogenase
LQMGKDLRNSKASVQGFDHIAQSAIRLLIHNGSTVTSVGFWDDKDQKHYTLQNDDGVDLSALLRITNAKGAINKERALRLGYQILPEDAWLEQNVDILIPASHPNAINAENVDLISKTVRVIAEGHPGATTHEADLEIHKRGIMMIPDLMTHAGGVTCSYLEQVQSNMNHYWEKQEVVEKIDAQMKHAFKTVSALAREKNMYMRDAAYRVAVDRVAKACRDRGWV